MSYPTPYVAGDQAAAADINASFLNVAPIGAVQMFCGNAAPTSYLLCNGAAVSRATYATLFGILCPSQGTVTISIASPGVVTQTSHGLATGDSIYLTTSGALPTGLTANTRYWVIKNDANTFWLATSLANALAGTKINTSGTQSGTHTMRLCPYGLGDGSTTFNVPDLQGKVPVGKNQSDSEFAGLGQTGGEKTHQLTVAELAQHSHDITIVNTTDAGSTYVRGTNVNTPTGTAATANAGSGTAHNNLQPYLTLNFIIRAL